MARRINLPGKTSPAKSSNGKTESDFHATEVGKVIDKVRALLEEQNAKKALDVVVRCKLQSPWITNASGVCLLRLGDAAQATRLFHGLLGHSAILLKSDAPEVFKTNLATAMLASNNLEGCLSVLHEIQLEENRVVRQLRSAIQRWKQGLSWWQRIKWFLGDTPTQPVELDFPLGELE
jgi:hypothetical protein